MSKHHFIFSLILLFLTACNSSSVITEAQLDTNSGSTSESTAENSSSSSTETESVIIESADVNHCNLSSEIRKVAIDTINQIRAEGRNCGTTFFAAADPIVWNNLLATAAQSHSDDMAKLNFFSHTGSNGSTLGDRVSDAGYVWQAVGENIAAGRISLQYTINAWLDSPGHCANIMKSSFVEMAIACTESSTSTYGVYWTQDFAIQR